MKIVMMVLDSLGVGAMPDAPKFGDSLSANTLSSVLEAFDDKSELKTLESLGFLSLIEENYAPNSAVIGRCAEASNGKDTVVGHWEICGVISEDPFPTFPNGFPKAMITVIKEVSGRGVLGNKTASGTQIIQELGPMHCQTGDLIVYTSSDSVLQIAAHENVVPVKELYDICQALRERFVTPDERVNRIIARPFIGNETEGFVRTERRHDYTVPIPEDNLLSALLHENHSVYAVGKIGDIFPNINFTKKVKTADNADGMKKTLDFASRVNNGLIFTNLVDFDMKYGHRRNQIGYAEALKAFDHWLPELMSTLDQSDYLLLTADHGCDPKADGTDHTREFIPILFWSPSFVKGVALEDRQSFSDIAATLADLFLVESYRGAGKSFREALLPAQLHIRG